MTIANSPLLYLLQSPMFRSPGLGTYGSFGIDTPGGTLAAEPNAHSTWHTKNSWETWHSTVAVEDDEGGDEDDGDIRKEEDTHVQRETLLEIAWSCRPTCVLVVNPRQRIRRAN